MAKPDVQAALDAVDMTYSELIDIVDDTRKSVMEDCDLLIEDVSNNIQDMSKLLIRQG